MAAPGVDIDAREVHAGQRHVIYDAAAIAPPDDRFFSADHWRASNALLHTSTGRGTAVAFRSDGGDYVLRHYRRGGQIQRLSRDRYLWFGLERTRAWREWSLLTQLQRLGLPAPRAVAARVERRLISYRADIVTRLIPGARTLVDALESGALTPDQWRRVGACIRRFHDAGIFHADLNARNILIDDHDQVFLIDFDRGGRRAPHRAWQQANLHRLRRSLEKCVLARDNVHYRAADFVTLLDGYDAVPR